MSRFSDWSSRRETNNGQLIAIFAMLMLLWLVLLLVAFSIGNEHGYDRADDKPACEGMASAITAYRKEDGGIDYDDSNQVRIRVPVGCVGEP